MLSTVLKCTLKTRCNTTSVVFVVADCLVKGTQVVDFESYFTTMRMMEGSPVSKPRDLLDQAKKGTQDLIWSLFVEQT